MAKSPDPIIINSEHGYKAAIKQLWDLWREHKYLTLVLRLGERRSMSQNDLFQKWARDWIAWKLGISPRLVSEEAHESMKYTIKKIIYQQTAWEWMLVAITDYEAGKTATKFRSSKKYGRGEMHQFLNLMQIIAAEDGCILESLGEHKYLKQRQVA